MRGLKLAIEPRPVSTWGVTLASRLPAKEWNDIRQKVYWEANYTCIICGSTKGVKHCHEVWGFDDKKRIQRLVDLQCLCRLCHDVKHFGRSSQVYSEKYIKELTKHWCKVNGLTENNFRIHELEIFSINRKRADKQYIVKVGRRTLT